MLVLATRTAANGDRRRLPARARTTGHAAQPSEWCGGRSERGVVQLGRVARSAMALSRVGSEIVAIRTRGGRKCGRAWREGKGREEESNVAPPTLRWRLQLSTVFFTSPYTCRSLRLRCTFGDDYVRTRHSMMKWLGPKRRMINQSLTKILTWSSAAHPNRPVSKHTRGEDRACIFFLFLIFLDSFCVLSSPTSLPLSPSLSSVPTSSSRSLSESELRPFVRVRRPSDRSRLDILLAIGRICPPRDTSRGRYSDAHWPMESGLELVPTPEGRDRMDSKSSPRRQ